MSDVLKGVEWAASAHQEQSEDPELEKNAPWGLARISHRDRLSFGTFNKYLYAAAMAPAP